MRDKVLDGYLVKQTPVMPMDVIEMEMASDDVLKKGLLFVGGARQGKTNVMMKVASDILENKTKDDIVVFFDVKGDYKKAFFTAGDMVLSPTYDVCLWNMFEELKNMGFGYALDQKIMSIVENLFSVQRSEREPFWTNAAAHITRCIILYMLYEADINDDDSMLNHREFCKLLDGVLKPGDNDIYENYRTILNAYDSFRTANLYIPPIENGNMAAGVITEIVTMRARLFNSTFGECITRNDQMYICPGLLTRYSGSKVLFLEYNPVYAESCTAVYRCFIDLMITGFIDPDVKKCGKLYIFLDEFAMLPKLSKMAEALNLGAGPGVRVIAGLQEIEQLRVTYSDNEHVANVLNGAFQSQIIFNSDTETIAYYQKLFGKALVQRSYIKPGGGLGYTEPVTTETLEIYDVQKLPVGNAVVHFSGRKAFITKFPLYELV